MTWPKCYRHDAIATLLSQQDRLLKIKTALPDAALLVERFTGCEAVSETFRFDLDCVSTNAYFDLKQLIGEEVTLRLLAEGTLKSALDTLSAAEHIRSASASCCSQRGDCRGRQAAIIPPAVCVPH